MAKFIKSHMTGNVWRVAVKVGDRVEEGSVVTILESMKMEMPVTAEEAGTITAVLIVEAQSVREGMQLFEYE